MRRALLAATLLAVPLLGGFECEVTVEPWVVGDDCTWGSFDDSQCADADQLLYCGDDGFVTSRSCASYCTGGTCLSDVWGYGWCDCPGIWEVGAACDNFTDYPGGNFCYDAQTVMMCGVDNTVSLWDCTTACTSSIGFCDYDASQGANWCMCDDWQWAPGYSCDYWSQFDQATCSGTTLTYCAETNVIGSVDCQAQCADWYGAGASATCGPDETKGYDGCVCEFTVTTCFDPYCYDGLWHVGCNPADMAEVWTDCNSYCISEMSSTKGVCNDGECWCG